MTKLLQKAIDQLQKLPASEQDAAAGALMDYLDQMRDLQLTDEQAAEVRRRLADTARKTVPLDQAREQLRRRGA